MSTSPLTTLFEPASIAVVGVSRDERGVGRRVWDNIRSGGYRGALHAINPSARELDGQPVLGSIDELPSAVDLAIIALPAEKVIHAIDACARRGVRNAVVLSAGFGEMGEQGVRLQRKLVERAHAGGLRVLGPNCLGFMRAQLELNASFSRGIGLAGDLALVSQSGAVCSALVDWAEQRRIGISTVVSLGAAADVGIGEVLDYLALDDQTGAILLYVEGVDHARALVSGMRAAARRKPVVIVKAGRHEAGHRAAASHTGAIVGGDAVFDAALRRTGAVRVAVLHELFSAANVLAHSARPRGDGLAIITNAGGLGVLAVDRAGDLALPLAQLGEPTKKALGALLPPQAAYGNPIDVLGDAPPDRYQGALAACLEDPEVHGIVVLLTPQAMTDPDAVARAIAEREASADKPVLACFMGGEHVRAARETLVAGGVASFASPEAAVEAFGTLAAAWRNRQGLLQLPRPAEPPPPIDASAARKLIDAALAQGRELLTQAEAFAVLGAFQIPHVPSEPAGSLDEALAAARRLGYPLALKIDSVDIVHKSDVGGVVLGIEDERALRARYEELLERVRERAPRARVGAVLVQSMLRVDDGRELLIGVTRDPALGPAIAVGAGGTLVELLGGGSVELPPLSAALARAAWQRSRVAPLLGAFRGMKPADTQALERVLERVSDLVCELPSIEELDINPLMVGPNGAIALDVRVIVRKRAPAGRYDHLAIVPYPRDCRREVQLEGGLSLTVRALRPDDGELEAQFIKGLSFRSKYLRFMHGVREASPHMLEQLTQLDYDRELALVATAATPDGSELAIAIGRYSIELDRKSCELGLAVGDTHHRRGIGALLTRELMRCAKEAGVPRMHAVVLADNDPMLGLLQALGFEAPSDPDDGRRLRLERALD